jgi:hypothetical protein
MADVVDQANDTAETFLAAELRKQQQRGTSATPMGIGMCINPACGEEIEGDGRWCGPACRDEWERLRKGRP